MHDKGTFFSTCGRFLIKYDIWRFFFPRSYKKSCMQLVVVKYTLALRKIDDENIIKSSLALNCFLKLNHILSVWPKLVQIACYILVYELYILSILNLVRFGIIRYNTINIDELYIYIYIWSFCFVVVVRHYSIVLWAYVFLYYSLAKA